MLSFAANFIILEDVKHVGDQGHSSISMAEPLGPRGAVLSFATKFIILEDVKHLGDQGQKSVARA